MTTPRHRMAWSVVAVPLLVGCGDNAERALPADAGPGADAALPAPPPGLALFDFAIAVDVTPDGRTAAFADFGTGAARLQLHDTVTGETTDAVEIGNPARTLATGISATGRVSALYGEPVEAGLWSAADGWVGLGSPHPAGCGEDVSSGFDISADGSVVVGLAWNGCTPTALRWSDAGGTGAFVPLAVLGDVTSGGGQAAANRATVVSDDGQVAAGFAANGVLDRTPARWLADGTGALLAPDETEVTGEVLSIDADGSVLAGVRGADAFVWTAGAGATTLPRLPSSLPADAMFPNAMSGDGALVFGGIGDAFFTTPTAFVWSAAAGTRALADVAVAAGVELPAGTILTSVLGVSGDATVLIGTAFDASFAAKTYALRVPAGAFDAP